MVIFYFNQLQYNTQILPCQANIAKIDKKYTILFTCSFVHLRARFKEKAKNDLDHSRPIFAKCTMRCESVGYAAIVFFENMPSSRFIDAARS